MADTTTEKDKQKFITIELSKKQIDMAHPTVNGKNGKTYVRVFAPGGGVFFYPAESIKTKENDENRVFFMRPEGTELTVHFSSRIEGVPDNAPNDQKYNNYTKTIRIEDMKEMYEEERRAFAEKKQEERENGTSEFVSMTVPTSWGSPFHTEKGDFVSLSIPINGTWYSFVLQQERFKESTRQEGMSYFSFPRKLKDNPDKDYMVHLKRSERLQDGTYEEHTTEISSTLLKEHVDVAVSKKEIQDLFVGTMISEKLIHPFVSPKSHKNFYEVSVPVYESGNEKAIFYKIVVPEQRIKDGDRDGQKYLSLFINNQDGEETVYAAKHNYQDNNGDWQTTVRNMTSRDVIAAFKDSAERYRAEHATDGNSIQDELNAGQNHTQGESEAEIHRNRHGR